nr:hypothetical protein [Tanacetum cinerariifolium]
HPVQNRESPENSFKEIVVSNPDQEKKPEATTDTELSSTKDIHPLAVQEPPQDLDIHQLIEECCEEVPEEQKQKMEDTIALDSKLLSINSINPQRLDKKEHEVKNVEEQQAERRNHAEKSLQNFRVIHKSSISLNISQISSIHEVAPILSTKEHEHLLSMGYEHLSITPETESNEVTKSNAENLLPIPSKCEVTLKDEIECDMPAKDVCSPVFTTFSNPLFKDNNDLDSSNDESLPDKDVPAEELKIYSNPLCDEDKINSDKLDPYCFNVQYDFVESLLNRDTFIDFSSKFDFSGELVHINPEIPKSNFDFEEEIRLSDNVLPPSDENDDDYDLLLEEVDLFLSDNSIPPGIENIADDPEGDIRFLEELLINDSILSHESFNSSFEDSPSISRPPPEPPDVELFFDLKPDMIAEEISDKVNEDKCFDPGREINVSIKIEDDNYFPFMFVIRFFLPYFIFPE